MGGGFAWTSFLEMSLLSTLKAFSFCFGFECFNGIGVSFFIEVIVFELLTSIFFRGCLLPVEILEGWLPLYLDIHFLGGSGGVSPSWSSRGSFSFSFSEEGSLELLEDMWAFKTFTSGEGETGFSTFLFECLVFGEEMGFAGILVLA